MQKNFLFALFENAFGEFGDYYPERVILLSLLFIMINSAKDHAVSQRDR